jgi:L-arabinonolactonase
MINHQVQTALNCQNLIGESCFWDPRDNSLWWTDIEGKKIWNLDCKNQSTVFNLPDRVCFILPRENDGFIVGFPKHISVSNQDFTSFKKICDVEKEIKETRINDAKVDPLGGIVFGTYNESPDKKNRNPIANLYRLSPDYTLSFLLNNITVANGIAFSQKENIMYFADTPTGQIRKFQYSDSFKEFKALEPTFYFEGIGEPDGGTIDSDNNYWSARVRGKCIICINKEDGSILKKIILPTENPTCLAFGGIGLSSLFITSLRSKPKNDDVDGNLYKIETGVKGVEQILSKI